MNKSFEEIILTNLINNEKFCRKALPHIKSEYFDNQEKAVYDLIVNFISKYNKLPTSNVLLIELQNSEYSNRSDVNEIFQTITNLEQPDKSDEEWLVESTETWCKDRAVHNAVMESISIIDGKSADKSEGIIPEILSKALSVTFDTAVGHDYIGDADSRFDFYNRDEEKLPFDLTMFNEITGGGLPNKTLNIILAGTGVGKSLAMCHLAADGISQGKNVLYITMEMAEERIAERIDANLLNVNIQEIGEMPEAIFKSRVNEIGRKSQGRLIIKEYPTAAAHSGHFKSLLSDLSLKKDFRPNIIFVDYLNICASSRYKGHIVNSYTYVKAIAEELRGLAVEHDLPVVTATQTTRSGFGNSDVDLTDTSESFGLPATADLMLALISTEELEQSGRIMIKQLKNRYNDAAYYRRFTVGIDRSKMNLYNVDDSEGDILSSDAPEEETMDRLDDIFDRQSRLDKFSQFVI